MMGWINQYMAGLPLRANDFYKSFVRRQILMFIDLSSDTTANPF